MKTSDHREITRLIFGREHEDVHVWLDETFGEWMGTGFSLFNHWVARHHDHAINEKYPDDPAKRAVARLHVVCDIASRWEIYFLPYNAGELRAFLRQRDIVLVTKGDKNEGKK